MRYAVIDSWVVAKRDLIHWLREPVRVFANLAYPVISVLIFGLVFGSAMNVFGGGDYIEFLLPGMFGQTIAFGVGTTMMMVSMDADRGVTDRFRASPMSQTGVVAGRSIADLVNSSLELLVLALCGLVIGWSFHDGLPGALAAFALFLWLRFAMVWVGIYLGLLVKPEAAQASWMFLFPLTMFANTFVSPELMPGWLRAVSEWNPLSSTVAAARELFGNPGVGGDSWAAALAATGCAVACDVRGGVLAALGAQVPQPQPLADRSGAGRRATARAASASSGPSPATQV